MEAYVVVCVTAGIVQPAVEKAILCETVEQARVVAQSEAQAYDNDGFRYDMVAIMWGDSASLETEAVETVV